MLRLLVRYSGLLFLAPLLMLCLSSCAEKVDNSDKDLFDLVNHFKKSGIKIEGAAPLMADTIHAQEAVTITVAKREIGLYKFDSTFKKQRSRVEKIDENGFVYIIGLKVPARVNGSFVMIDADTNPEKDKLIKAFDSFR